jgi:hypothetical protein
MVGIDDAIANASKLIDTAINKIWPDPTAAAQAQAMVIKASSDAALASLQIQMSVMLAEANSEDKWTSRARPSFMYVMYVLMLACIPMGLVFALAPHTGEAIATGMQRWLAAIPESMWTLFGVCFSGYTLSRGVEKVVSSVQRK